MLYSMKESILAIATVNRADREMPNMENKKTHWGVLALIAFIALLGVLPPLLPPPKARASRIQAVNHIANLTFTIPSTNALPTGTTNNRLK